MGVSCGSHLREACHRASDRCSRLFPCLSDPARRSALSLKVALVILHLVFAGVLFLFDNDLIEKTKRNHELHELCCIRSYGSDLDRHGYQNKVGVRILLRYTAIYVSLFVATLVQYFVTSGTSPGYVLDAQKAVDETDAIARRTLLASNFKPKWKFLITVDGRNHHRGNATAWTKLVMDLYPPGASIRLTEDLPVLGLGQESEARLSSQ
ncbi:protein S-acyltransferase 10 [Sesamum angolense]|uniref:Protein S-acyltransferase 10 n=1 Tax=Sesamum angolense TaxID=2727404 RepID=A0AAE1VXJ5_9LAMI|nr:protein S-acyltransferase 10 [Sesamum angolense]